MRGEDRGAGPQLQQADVDRHGANGTISVAVYITNH